MTELHSVTAWSPGGVGQPPLQSRALPRWPGTHGTWDMGHGTSKLPCAIYCVFPSLARCVLLSLKASWINSHWSPEADTDTRQGSSHFPRPSPSSVFLLGNNFLRIDLSHSLSAFLVSSCLGSERNCLPISLSF